MSIQNQELEQDNNLDGGTYEIIQSRLQKQKSDLIDRLVQLNVSRSNVFGSVETKLIANNRINTKNSCIARDIVTIGDYCIFGYNVHFGLRTDIQLEDVFGVYRYDGDHFVSQNLSLLDNAVFHTDFNNLYKYYRNTIFSKFAIIGNYLHLVFQLSESVTDVKTFKWLIKEDTLVYIDNRSDHEFVFPIQHEFKWQDVSRDMHRYGVYPHIAILDKVFVETVGGDLTIKIEDNTDDGKGIYSESVRHVDQTLDDGNYRYADLGNMILLEIKPFQEVSRYFIYNHKIQEVQKVDSLKDSVILLPNDQGIIFSNGYYLQSGGFKIFDNEIVNLQFQKRVVSPNGEDFFYVFYHEQKGLYVLMSYNSIEQEVKTPIICNGFTFLKNGELCYFKSEDDQTKHHVIQIWQTPFSKGIEVSGAFKDSLLFKIGNKDIVKAMSECQVLVTLLNKEDSYDGLYEDLAKQSLDIVDSYYWIKEKETHQLSKPLNEINAAANSAIDEFEKVVQLRKVASKTTQETTQKVEELLRAIKSSSFKTIDHFVQALSQLRVLRGELIGLKEVRYVDVSVLESLEEELIVQNERISKHCVSFLLDEKALKPYHDQIKEKQDALAEVSKVIVAKQIEKEVNQIVLDLEMLIQIVSNLAIEDTSHSTKIIDAISLIFSKINQLKSAIKTAITTIGSKEASADFSAQLKLIDQSIVNYLDVASTPEKIEELLNKVSVQLEELEGKFSDYDDFIADILEKREEVYNAFEARKNSIVEARNKKAVSLENSAKRILKGIVKRADSFKTSNEINGYFASDLMIGKIRDIVEQLHHLNDTGKAEVLETSLKVAKEDAIRRLKDRKELYEEGENVIKLGAHKFGVNNQPLDLTIVYKDKLLFYHLTGTNFYQEIEDRVLLESKAYWNQSFVSENELVYRGSYLAYRIFKTENIDLLKSYTSTELLAFVKAESSKKYSEGYVKGVHDVDATAILTVLLRKQNDLEILTYSPRTRGLARYFWELISEEKQQYIYGKVRTFSEVLAAFPAADYNHQFIGFLAQEIACVFDESLKIIALQSTNETYEIAQYLFEEFLNNLSFKGSQIADGYYQELVSELKKKKVFQKLKSTLDGIQSKADAIELSIHWVDSFLEFESNEVKKYLHEIAGLLVFENTRRGEVIQVNPSEKISGLMGDHMQIDNGEMNFNYHRFIEELNYFSDVNVKAFEAYKETKHKVLESLKQSLKLEEFKPRVLSSFVRNKLIDQVYLPIFGDNLAKQLGSIGANKRTDRMGMLLLVSPPGYGKTTLMEYMANRLGLIFMKINGPAIGHEVTSVDPMSAKNSAAREELKKLNLAFEMGNNVMLYLDDIQHCNPEFLQKFISLADGTRKIEGVYNNKPKTYDLRANKFCVIMAGNPYTESGDKFQIPDMLANRADIYNLGDIIGDTEELFKLSLIENSMTANPVLHQLKSRNFKDVYAFIKMAETGSKEGVELEGSYTKQEINEYVSVLEKVILIRNRVMSVNANYIKSAAMEDAHRVEPSFKLQGSYRDMNKLVSKVVPIMNKKELATVLSSHYENESQTLTSAAEANLLKYKELSGELDDIDKERWENIKTVFVKNNKLKGLGNANEMAQVLVQMMQFSEHLEGIQDVLRKGLGKNG